MFYSFDLYAEKRDRKCIHSLNSIHLFSLFTGIINFFQYEDCFRETIL